MTELEEEASDGWKTKKIDVVSNLEQKTGLQSTCMRTAIAHVAQGAYGDSDALVVVVEMERGRRRQRGGHDRDGEKEGGKARGEFRTLTS